MFRDEKRRWWVDYYTPDGKRRRKIAGETKEAAERLLRAIRSSVDRGTYVDPVRAPGFSDFCKIFRERHSQHLSSDGKSSGRIERLKRYFGDRKLSAITADMIEQYRLERVTTGKARDGKSPVARASVNREVGLLRVIFGKAVKWVFLATNPTAKIEDYDEGEQRERYLTGAEIRLLLQKTKLSFSPLLRPVVYLALETGMRRGSFWCGIPKRVFNATCRSRAVPAGFSRNGRRGHHWRRGYSSRAIATAGPLRYPTSRRRGVRRCCGRKFKTFDSTTCDTRSPHTSR
jgi:hypothetical protein